MRHPRPTSRRLPSPTTALGLLLLGGLAWGVSGCAGGDQTANRGQQTRGESVADAGLADLREPTLDPTPASLEEDDLEQLVRRSASQLDELFEMHERGLDPAQTPGLTARDIREARQPQWRPVPIPDEPEPEATLPTITNAESDPPTADMAAMFDGETFLELIGARHPVPGAKPEPDRSPGQIRDEIAQRLAEVLESIAAAEDSPEDAFRAAAGLAGLEAVRPGLLEEFEHADRFTSEELRLLRTASEIARALGAERPPDTDRALELMTELANGLAVERGMRIRTSELCTSVSGYGRTTPFVANRFLAGRAQPVIVYTEVDHFSNRVTHDDRTGETLREVKLSQRLELFHEVDGLNVWNKAAQIDRSVSRNELRDYYLIHQVTLPEHLTVGKYVLKVVMRDLNDEHEAVDEALIPIEIVSDPAMAYPSTQRASAG